MRKPLKDNLLIMELLVARSPAFMNRFFNRPIDEYAIDKIDESKKKKIIREANKLVLTGIPPITAKLLYTIRYDRKHYMTFQKIWDRTAHIITTNKHYKTENGNLNMIFNDEELIEQHVGYFYKTMPSVYYYALKLIIYFLYKEDLITEEEYKANDNLISISYLYVLIEENEINYEECSITCNCCNQEWDLSNEEHRKEFIKLSNTFSCICPYCSSAIRSDRFIIDNKK